MSSVSVDNNTLTDQVSRLHSDYLTFQTTLRGSVAEILSGLGSGVYSLVTMNKVLHDVGQKFLNTARESVLEDLGNLSEIALKTSKAEIDSDVLTKALSVSETLYKGFAAEVESSLSLAVSRDVRSALDFIRLQISAGRFTATTEELTHDLSFQIAGKMRIPTESFVFRETNWSYRTHYNTVMVSTLLNRGIEEAKVDGGSSDGKPLNLMQFDQISGKIFHHNAKSLVQPID